ncbi:2TM domain-containing protein [Rhodospirillum centenum]|nr:2TM domain-containing protein [Rhodospirillum centenum]
MPTRDADPGSDPDARARRRRGTLLNHLLAYFGTMVVLVPVNFLTTPDYPWFLFPLVAWFAPLGVHVAWVLGLFDRPRS